MALYTIIMAFSKVERSKMTKHFLIVSDCYWPCSYFVWIWAKSILTFTCYGRLIDWPWLDLMSMSWMRNIISMKLRHDKWYSALECPQQELSNGVSKCVYFLRLRFWSFLNFSRFFVQNKKIRKWHITIYRWKALVEGIPTHYITCHEEASLK